MTRRRITVAAAVLAAAVLAGNGASAQGLADLDGEWMGTVTGRVIMSDALEVDMHLHGDHVDGHWHMPVPPALALLFPDLEELGGEVRGGDDTFPRLAFEVDGIDDCEIDVEVEEIEADRWEGHWHTHGCSGFEDGGEMMLMRAGTPVPALPLVGVLVLAAVLARRGWRGLQGRR